MKLAESGFSPSTPALGDLPRAVVTAAQDAIIVTDVTGHILLWNPASSRMFGHDAGAMIGQSIDCLVPADRPGEDGRMLAALARGEAGEPTETLRQSADGRLIHVAIAASAIHDEHGRVVAVARVIREIADGRSPDRVLARVSRLHSALSEVNLAVINAASQPAMLDEICRALVQTGGFRCVGICWHMPDTRQFATVASHGDDTHYLDRIDVFSDERPQGQGPMGQAFRSRAPYICNDVWSDPATLAWRSAMRERGWHASAAFPIIVAGSVCAILTIYSQECGFFKDREISLLVEAAREIAFGIENLGRDEAHRKASQQARSERIFTAALIDSIPGVLYLYDENLQFIRWNHNFEQCTGYSGDEIRGMRPADFIAPRHRDLVGTRIDDVFDRGASSVEALLLSKDGTATPYYFTGLRISLDGRAALLGMGIDISARVRAEDAMRAAQAELARVARVSLLGEFAASVGHEINQPLAAIVTNSNAAERWLAKNPPNFDEVRQTIARIVRDAERAGGIIARLRAFVTREAPVRAPVDLNQALAEVLAFARTDIDAADIEVRATLDQALPAVLGDHIQLQQVLLNLIGNAIDAMRGLADRPRVLTLRSFVDDDAVCVLVQDCGAGFEPAEMARLFEHFYSTKTGGMGLGLAISRSIVDALGGRIVASNATPHGAALLVRLPCAPLAAP